MPFIFLQSTFQNKVKDVVIQQQQQQQQPLPGWLILMSQSSWGCHCPDMFFLHIFQSSNIFSECDLNLKGSGSWLLFFADVHCWCRANYNFAFKSSTGGKRTTTCSFTLPCWWLFNSEKCVFTEQFRKEWHTVIVISLPEPSALISAAFSSYCWFLVSPWTPDCLDFLRRHQPWGMTETEAGNSEQRDWSPENFTAYQSLGAVTGKDSERRRILGNSK